MKGKKKLKKRLDQLLYARGLAEDMGLARALILSGRVMVNENCLDKAGQLVNEDALISIKERESDYVSRGALKLKAALDKLSIPLKDMVCMDVGASTGGFTELLLERGASRVFAVDVAYGQLAWKLRQDKRVINLERSNIRYMEEKSTGEKMDLITIDASFISLRLVIPACMKFLKESARILALVKPQFEAKKEEVEKGGVVSKKEVKERILDDLDDFFSKKGFFTGKAIASPILGPKGNQEFILPLWTRYEDKKAEENREILN